MTKRTTTPLSLDDMAETLGITIDEAFDLIEQWVSDSIVEATDGCAVEPDGICPHGHPSWLLALGYI